MYKFIIKKVITAIVLFSSLNTRAELALSYINDCLGGYRYETPASSGISLIPAELLNSVLSGTLAGNFSDGDRISNYGYTNGLSEFTLSEVKAHNELDHSSLYAIDISKGKNYVNYYINILKERRIGINK